MPRSRVPGYVTTQSSNAFGLDVQVIRSPLPKVNHLPNGDKGKDGETRNPLFTGYREVIPPGVIGSSEGDDLMLPPPTYVDTVPTYPTEQNDTRLHGPMGALRAADTQSIPFQSYASFQPRTMPMPRAAQDDVALPYRANEHAADPLMKDEDSSKMLLERDVYRKDLYGKNRDGMLHNPVGGDPPAPASPATNQATTRATTYQTGRGMTRTGHGKRPPELADQPMSTARVKDR